MKRKTCVAIASAMVAGLLGAVAPARAEEGPTWPQTCYMTGGPMPTPGTVYVDSEGLHINADAAGGDVEALTQWAVDKTVTAVDCIVSGLPPTPIFCVANVAWNAPSYVNVSGTQVDVYYPALLADLRACGFETI